MPKCPEHMSVVEWWNENSKKGIIDALIEIGDMLSHMRGDSNTGNMEAVVDYIDDKIGDGIPDDYLSAHEIKLILDDDRIPSTAEAKLILLGEHLDSVINRDTTPDYINRYLGEEGRVTGYLHTLRMIKNLAELKGY